MANNSDQRIFEQIEQKADFYQPAVYELLTFYQALELNPDPMDGQFVPLTTVQPWEQARAQIFAVGLIPPTSNVTGRILDRSASVRALQTGNDADLPDEEFPDDVPDTLLVRPNAGVVESGSLSSRFGKRQLHGEDEKPHLGCDIAAPVGAEVRAATDGVVVDISPDGTRTGYGNTIIVQHADGKLTLYAHLDNFAVEVGTPVKGGTVIGRVGQTSSPNPQPHPHLHFEVLTKRVEHNGKIVVNSGRRLDGTQGPPVPPRLEPQRWLSSVGRSLASSKAVDEGVTQQTFTGDANSNGNWVEIGAENANKASQTASQVASKDLNQTNLGKQFQAQQQAWINMMQAALDQMAKTPPLRLLVHPQSFRISAEKLISDGNWGRNGPIIEHWGENQDTIEGSGKVAAFYSLDVQNGNGPGLTRTARQFSASYQNLLSLWLIYKNNGGVWFPDPIVPTGSKAKNLSVVGSVYLYFDHILYIGSFDSFNLTESETAPFTLEYSFSFTVRAWYLLDHLDDTQYMYGLPATPALSTSNSGTSPLMGGHNSQPSPGVALPPGTVRDPLGDLNDPNNLLS